MKEVKVYGSGCRNCKVTAELIEQISHEISCSIHLEKVTDLEQIMKAGVVSTPAVGVDGKLVHSGSVPTAEQVKSLLS